MDKHEQAKQDYIDGMKYKDIATKYDVSLNTVKSWKKRHGWERGAPKEKSVHPKTEKVAPKIVKDLMNNDELTDKHKLFCLYYLQRFNATWAYRQVYECNYETAMVNASKLLRNAKVQDQIVILKEEIASDLHVTAEDIAKDLAKQSFSNIGDYVDFKSETKNQWYKVRKDSGRGKYVDSVGRFDWVKKIDPDTNEQATYVDNVVNFKDGSEVDTSLIKSIRIDKGEAIVELYDKQKAQSELMKYLSNDYKLVEARTRKLDAEARIVGNKADKLTNNSQDNDLLSALSDVINGGDDSNETEVQSETDGEH